MSWRAWAAFWALGVIWGVPYFFIRIAVQEVSPFVVAWGRLTIAALMLLPIAWHRGALKALWPHRIAILGFAVAEFIVPFSAISFGERWISSSITGILIAGVPLTVVIIGRFFGVNEPIGARRAVGLVLGLCGVVALLGFATVSGPSGWAGVGCMVLATIGYAIGPLIIQRYLHELASLGPIAASQTVASVVLLLPAVATWPHRTPSTVTLASIAILGVLCSAIAMLLMFYLVRAAGASRAAIITYLNPAVATLLGVGLLRESLGAAGMTAFVVILVGSFLATHNSQPA